MNLEDFIKNNIDEFDTEEPRDGHFERFAERINKKHRKITILRWSASVAASVILLATVGILRQNPHQSDRVSIACESTENMKQCYLEKMNDVAIRIDMLTKDFDQWTRQQVMDEVRDVIEATQTDIDNEIPPELPDDKIKFILSDYYRHNLENLNTIATSLEENQILQSVDI